MNMELRKKIKQITQMIIGGVEGGNTITATEPSVTKCKRYSFLTLLHANFKFFTKLLSGSLSGRSKYEYVIQNPEITKNIETATGPVSIIST